jgi:hypothetical protein
MITVDLKKEHSLYAESEANGGIDYQGHGAAFLKNDLSEKLFYCEDLDREEVQDFFNKADEYYFGACTLEWEFKQGATLGRGKQAMWFAKYFKSGYYEEPFE